MNKWLIKSTTRTGSHLVYSLLESSGLRSEHVSWNLYRQQKSPPVWPLLANHDNLRLSADDNNIVVHDHTTWMPPDPENWNIVHTQRLDKAAQTLSSIFASKINEYLLDGLGGSTYSEKHITPFYLNPKDTLVSHRKRIYYENNMKNLINSRIWKSYNLMYFEDLILANPAMIAHIFQIEYDTDKCKWSEQKNPRKAQDIIINYKELYNVLSEVTLNR
jgi:hypothetical protein